MKAFLLAAGYGTRLKPLTDTTPKCLVPIKCRPLLAWWFDLLLKHGVTDAIVNTHYLAAQVRNFITGYNALHTGLNVREFYEPELLGSGGTVLANKTFVADEENFMICYADNLTNVNLTQMQKFHKSHDAVMTMALFHTNHPTQCGIASLDNRGLVTSFIEKPEHPECDLANAGVYIARQKIFKYFPDRPVIDLGKDVLPNLIGKMYGWEIKDYLLDIGTPDNYEKAQKEWQA